MTKYIQSKKVFKGDRSQSRKLKELFEIEPESNLNQKNDKIKIQYNEKIFFNPAIKKNEHFENIDTSTSYTKQEELAKIINNVISSTMKSGPTDKNPSIKVNLNINNNYYNSNYNYMTSKESISDNSSSLSTSDKEKSSNSEFQTKFIKDEPIRGSRASKYNSGVRTTGTLPNIDIIYPPSTSSNSLYIPCINCNNLVNADDIEGHSNSCFKVVEEVLIAESSTFLVHLIDLKLRKLQEHIVIIRNSEFSINNSELQKEMHYILLLSQYIEDSFKVSKIDNKSIAELKKILLNIDTSTMTYKGSMGTLVLIERTRVLVSEKINIFKEDIRKTVQTKKANERKSGSINSLRILELEKEMEEKKKLAEKLEAEKEMIARKVNNLKKSPITMQFSPNIRSSNKNLSSPIKTIEEFQDENNDDLNNLNLRPDSKKVYNTKNVVDDINSDVDNLSRKSEDISDCTSMASSVSSKTASEFYRSNPNDTRDDDKLTHISEFSANSASPEMKKLYQEFIKTFLKVKFEKIHNSHKGQQICEKVLFKECISRNIPQSNWADYIVAELKQPSKYGHFTKKDTKTKNKKLYTTTNMEVINEEF